MNEIAKHKQQHIQSKDKIPIKQSNLELSNSE